jgi:N-acetyl-anhydromuramyl-L-alanine amidase AmpD
MLTQLATVLQRVVPVTEIDGWQTRGHGQMTGVSCIVLHHTAGPTIGESPSLRVVREGRPGLAGPLAHIVVGRSGTWYVVAAGLCYHAGATFQPWQSNANAIGIEAEATGTSAWPQIQYDSLVRGTRALAEHYGVPHFRVLGHKEVAKPAGRKIDPNFSMAEFRAALAAQVAPPPQQVTTSRPRIRRGDAGALVMLVQRYLGVAREGEPGYGLFGPATEAAVRRYQQMRGLSIDGEVGEQTWASIAQGLRGPGV